MSDKFTIATYRQLVRLALQQYPQASYRNIPWGERFLLWRHDCDLSLNRALVLAQIEAEEGLRSTFFLNPHSEYYNLLQANQALLVLEIFNLGHDIGLHFDAGYYGNITKLELEVLMNQEASWLEQIFGRKPLVFSFHNPVSSHLQFEDESYGGLLNCYSRRFKTEVGYCSDSNGYWRFRSLSDVLTQAVDPCLQVLTHPGWWQDAEMPPRRRVFRCVYGRAQATMADYDAVVRLHGRENISGLATALDYLREVSPQHYVLLDQLWMSGEFPTLFVELWRLHESQINKLCKAVLRKDWKVPANEVNAFFESPGLGIDGWRLFAGIFDQPWQSAVGSDTDVYREWVRLRNQLIHGCSSAPREVLEEGCAYLCKAIQLLAAWGTAQPIGYDGLAHLGTIGIPTCKTADGSLTDRLDEVAPQMPGFPSKRWAQFKMEISNSSELGDGT